MADAIDRRRRDEREAASDANQEPAHRRVHLPVGPTRHDVFEPTDLRALLVADGTSQQAGQRHDGVEDPLLGQDAAGPTASLVRQSFGVAGSAGQQPGSARRARRRWRGHGGTSYGVVERIVSGRTAGRVERGQQLCNRRPLPSALSARPPPGRPEGRIGGGREGSAQVARGRCAEGPTGGFAPLLHGHTSFTIVPAQGNGPKGRTDPIRATIGGAGSPVSERVGTDGYRDPHGPRIPARGRGIPGRNRRLAEGESPRGLGGAGVLHDARSAEAVQRGVDNQAVLGRLDLRQLAGRIRGEGAEPPPAGRAERGVRPSRGAAAGRLLRRHARRSDDPAMGHRGTEAALHPRHLEGRDLLVSGVQRAGRGLGPGQPEDQGGARRRRVGDQRAEGVDHPGAVRRLHLPAGADRPRCTQARGHLLPAGPDATARGRGASDRTDRRIGRVQRGLLHQCALPQGQRDRRGEQRLEGCHDDARVRARNVGDDRTPPLPKRVQRNPPGRATGGRTPTR